MQPCSFKGCPNPAFQASTGLCRSHVSQMSRNGYLKPIQKRKYKRQSPDGLCTHPGCEEAAQAKGLCPHHLWASQPRRPRKRQPNISIAPSTSGFARKPKPHPKPARADASELEKARAEIESLKATIVQLKRMKQHDIDRDRRKRSEDPNAVMLAASLAEVLEIIDRYPEVKDTLSRGEEKAVRRADELLCPTA